ncbi:MAG: Stp1/IreP family PP2C-type Ser/Thr phosphatase [Oscillospiraceae bacterium]|nr:Stp1/IreP family PP2C-type Ser/Thr phosphatase [Oscillospiraceae bacterium]
MRFYSKTDIGKKRTENQDRVWAGQISMNAAAVVLCDGMGGENAGSRASQMTVDIITHRLRHGFRENGDANSIRNLMLTSFIAANTQVYEEAFSDVAKRGMGTTCVCAIVHEGRAYIVNVGDSRAYHIFDNSVQQITKDHTYIRVLLEDGTITPQEARTHPNRNAITRAIGAEADIIPDYFELPLHKDSILLLSSDGLHSYGDDVKIAQIVLDNPKGRVCDLLVDYALANGGNDNITVGLITA